MLKNVLITIFLYNCSYSLQASESDSNSDDTYSPTVDSDSLLVANSVVPPTRHKRRGARATTKTALASARFREKRKEKTASLQAEVNRLKFFETQASELSNSIFLGLPDMVKTKLLLFYCENKELFAEESNQNRSPTADSALPENLSDMSLSQVRSFFFGGNSPHQ